MARTLFFVLAALAAVALASADQDVALPDENEICLGNEHEEVVVLDNTIVKVPTARRCYKQGSSVLGLRCDFDKQQFQLTLNSTGYSYQSFLLDYQPSDQKLGGLEMALKATCDEATWTPANVLYKTIDFIAKDDDALNPVLGIDATGRAFYNVSIFLSEKLFGKDEDCRYVSAHGTHLNLYCCADPLPAVIELIEAPLIVPCNITTCSTPRFGCGCLISENNMQVIVSTTGGTLVPSDVGVQLEGLSAAAVGHEGLNTPSITLFPASLSQTALHQCGENVYGAQNLVFHDNEEATVAVTCDIKYCAKDPVSRPGLPPCRVVKQSPNGFCKSSYF